MPSDLCRTFRQEAGRVWSKMQAAATRGLWLSEETITETTLLNIALEHQSGAIIIDLATKPEEVRHGADWEWWLVQGQRGVGFRVQAKRLFGNGHYKSLITTGATRFQQLHTLVSAAHRDGLCPLYCFFNSWHPDGDFYRKYKCRHSYNAPSFWGCALAFPEQIEQANSNELSILKSIQYPWHTLVCNWKRAGLLGAASRFARDSGVPGDLIEPVSLPERVMRLIDLSEHRNQRLHDPGYLEDEDLGGELVEGLAGLMLIQQTETD